MAESKGKFVWYELMTTDADAAEGFYRDVVGWKAADSGMPDMRYTILSAGERPVAGLMTLPAEAREAGARPGWMGYIGVPDVDAAVASVQRAGGSVHRPAADIPNVGRFAVVADPQGVAFVLFTPNGGEQGPPASQQSPGNIGWHELVTTDWQAAFDFYSGQFGWTKAEAMDMGAMGTYQLFAAGGETIGGMMNRPPQVPASFWLFYFNVPGIDAAMERVKNGGGQILVGPMEVPGGAWIVQGLDPQGAMFALVAPTR